MPADLGARGMIARVEAVPVLRGDVDAADEGDSAVDHDRLLVVAVEGPLAAVHRTWDARLGELTGDLAHISARRAEERERRACPQKDAVTSGIAAPWRRPTWP